MNALIDRARAAGYASMDGTVLSANAGMLKLAERLGFVAQPGSDASHTINVVLALKPERKTE